MSTERKRDGGIEAPAWWPGRAAAAKRDLGLSNDEIAAAAIVAAHEAEAARATPDRVDVDASADAC